MTHKEIVLSDMGPTIDESQIEETNAIALKTDDFRTGARHDGLDNVFYENLAVFAKFWIKAIKTIIVSAKYGLIPVVKAKPPPPPDKPKPMKSTDLPLYQSPHTDYKEYVEEKSLCPNVRTRMLHNAMLPSVSCARKCGQDFCAGLKKEVDDTYTEISGFLLSKKKEVKTYMRCPSHLNERYATVAIGGLSGFVYSYKRSIPAKCFYTGLGLLATGSLCFPKETDKYFKDFCYYSTKMLLAAYNATCKKEFSFRERLACKSDMPAIPKPVKSPCPEKKKK